MTCPVCRTTETEQTGRIRARDGRFEYVCAGCDVRYYRDESNTPQGTV